MILGVDVHPAAQCFVELDEAITAMRGPDAAPVCLNAHTFPNLVPEDGIVYNLENVGVQVDDDAFQGHTLWDFSLRNVEAWKGRATHVPVGYHPTMERFAMLPYEERDIDVVLTGCLNDRRARILVALAEAGLAVATIEPGQAYGAKRDAVLARSKLALNVLFHPDGVHPVLRSAHCAANRLPVVCEQAPETPEWVSLVCAYERIVDGVLALLEEGALANVHFAARSYEAFRDHPMVLP